MWGWFTQQVCRISGPFEYGPGEGSPGSGRPARAGTVRIGHSARAPTDHPARQAIGRFVHQVQPCRPITDPDWPPRFRRSLGSLGLRLSPASSLKHCPDLLVPVMTNILASRPIVNRLSGDMQAPRTLRQKPTMQCLHRQTVTLTRKEYDELMMLFNRTMGQAFIVPLRRSQFCTVSVATPPLLAKHLVHISLRQLASTRIMLGQE